jgi:hypothetical protein
VECWEVETAFGEDEVGWSLVQETIRMTKNTQAM